MCFGFRHLQSMHITPATFKASSSSGFGWRIATSEIVVCTSIPFLGMFCRCDSASVSGDSGPLNANIGIMVSLSSRLRSLIEQYNAFELL